MKIRTRFAPSPTGDLHIGGVRTALYNWLFARQQQGEFILRIEDTDLQRSTEQSTQSILEGMKWLGLDWQQEPIYQSQRLDHYQTVIQQLLESGQAYKCYCTKERLQALREEQLANKQKPRYDGHCRAGVEQPGQPFVVRFKNPLHGVVTIPDIIHGAIHIANSELDDLVIARTDGTPTYHLSAVVDDWQLGISHVIRGDDHINNTPRQINILQALGAPVPRYAHVPMILGADGKRLSKRHGAVSVLAYRQQGYTPQALLNYLARLGWSHGDDEIFSLDQLVEHFSLEKVNKAPAAFNQSKLDWLNQHYLTHLPREQLVQQLAWQARQQQLDTTQGPALAQVLTVFAERVKTLAELVSSCRYCYEDFTEYEPKAAKKHLRPVAAEGLAQLKQRLAVLQSWDNDALQQVVDDLAAELQVNMGKIAQPLRVAVTGGSSSPGISDTLRLIGQERVIKRIDQALAYIAERAANG